MSQHELSHRESVYLFNERKEFLEAPAIVAKCGPIIIIRCSAPYIHHDCNKWRKEERGET